MYTLSSLWTESADGQFGIWMSALSGIAAALAVALAMTVYFRLNYRSGDVVRHGRHRPVRLRCLLAGAVAQQDAYSIRYRVL